MKKQIAIGALSVTGLIVVAAQYTPADADNRGEPVIGPDVVCSEVGNNTDFSYRGQANGISAFSIASTSCNLGDAEAEWIDSPGNARNPVIAQNLYRMSADGNRFEMIGMSWLKHSFCAVSQFGDNCPPTCMPNGTCNYLALGCADTYGSGLNDGAGGGPRWEINPVGVGPNGVHDDIYVSPSGPSAIRGRLQVHQTDILADGSRYFAEIQYVTHDEDFERRWNNASYREVTVTSTSMTPVNSSSSDTHTGDPAIQAWADNNPNVNMVAFEDDPGIGRFNLGSLVTDNGDGTWTYEYALHNLNSNRAANRFMVPVGSGVNVSSTGFHDVDYHSGDGWNDIETFDGTDWPASNAGGDMTWSTSNFTTDPNANALRWGSLYNFRLTTDTAPVAGQVTVGMYRDGGRDTVNVPVQVPGPAASCPTDLAGDDGVTDVFDLFELLNNWGTSGPGADLAAPTNVVDVFDLFELLGSWGACP